MIRRSESDHGPSNPLNAFHRKILLSPVVCDIIFISCVVLHHAVFLLCLIGLMYTAVVITSSISCTVSCGCSY